MSLKYKQRSTVYEHFSQGWWPFRRKIVYINNNDYKLTLFLNKKIHNTTDNRLA